MIPVPFTYGWVILWNIHGRTTTTDPYWTTWGVEV